MTRVAARVMCIMGPGRRAGVGGLGRLLQFAPSVLITHGNTEQSPAPVLVANCAKRTGTPNAPFLRLRSQPLARATASKNLLRLTAVA